MSIFFVKRSIVTLVVLIEFFENLIVRCAESKPTSMSPEICPYGGRPGAKQILFGEFDPGSERTLAAWFRHASRTILVLRTRIVAKG
jgi:hypothetical protein